MKKKKLIISITIISLLIVWWFVQFIWENFYCTNIQRRCTMYDLSEFENEEDIEFYSSLNKKCASGGKECWFKRAKTYIKKWRCRYQYKEYLEKSKNRRYFKADTYNPCPDLYSLKELNDWFRS